jgi:acyl-CoA hydrolase
VSPTRLATHALFAPPNNKVSAADYAIGLHASSLVVDGGTLQIGIGSLGDAIGQALIVRDRTARRVPAHPEACARTAWPAANWAALTPACTAARRCSSTASCA